MSVQQAVNVAAVLRWLDEAAIWIFEPRCDERGWYVYGIKMQGSGEVWRIFRRPQDVVAWLVD